MEQELFELVYVEDVLEKERYRCCIREREIKKKETKW